ncbi:hypothetical protein COLO4_36189 [Corchorus olitorius]|uniref:F-box domain-containing protein n=1 Tax=Corchorus olitorius TaxID=93759 RepID=A0A1R3GAM8_9ROSI|nr:hypothetical protein COLO4_36189 [Corchorus olitorius]
MASKQEVINNEHLLHEILVRLPAKPLQKFKLVSKQWLSLISNPKFCLTHSRFQKRSVKPQALLLDVLYPKLPSDFKFVTLNPDTDHYQLPNFDFIDAPNVRIVQSCSGLLLCSTTTTMDGRDPDPNLRYFICNPVNKEFKHIALPQRQRIYHAYQDVDPDIGVDPSRQATFRDLDQWANLNLSFEPLVKATIEIGVNLAFDPLKSPHYKILTVWANLLIGKNPQSNICFAFPRYSIDIYSSETESWSLGKVTIASDHAIRFERAVYLNGALHWDCAASSEETMYIDIISESVKQMPMPKEPNSKFRYFGESGGHLHFVAATGHSFLNFRVFELKADYSSWLLKYDVDLDVEPFAVIPTDRPNFIITSYLMSCAVQSEEGNGDSLVLVILGNKAISYHLVDRTVQELPCSNRDNFFYRAGNRFYPSPYFETLYYI